MFYGVIVYVLDPTVIITNEYIFWDNISVTICCQNQKKNAAYVFVLFHKY